VDSIPRLYKQQWEFYIRIRLKSNEDFTRGRTTSPRQERRKSRRKKCLPLSDKAELERKPLKNEEKKTKLIRQLISVMMGGM